MDDYHKLTFDLKAHNGFTDVLMYELGEIGFESFEEQDSVLHAYIRSDLYDEDQLKDLLKAYEAHYPGIKYQAEQIPAQNWNSVWESDYAPIEIDRSLRIRAGFHAPDNRFEHEIVIVPKMSFGTGHHETTRLMARTMQTLDIKGKKVLDMGCGTGILAIYAEKRGAAKVWAIDIEDAAYENTLENAAINGCSVIHVEKGGAEKIPAEPFSIILANINRNILLQQIPVYAQRLKPGGYLLLSGFFDTDVPVLQESCRENGMDFVSKEVLNKWACVLFKKGM